LQQQKQPQDMNYRERQAECKRLGLAATGNNAALLERLLGHSRGEGEGEAVQKKGGSWFMIHLLLFDLLIWWLLQMEMLNQDLL
jgi:hypothetical protein